MREYTVVYALTRNLGHFNHECYHHFARVVADDPIAAEDQTRADVAWGFEYLLIAILEGHHQPIALGATLEHRHPRSAR